MYKKILALTCLFFTVLSSTLAIADMCKTHQPCAPGASCTCNVGASGAYGRFFYFDFSDINKGNTYICKFTDTMAPFSLVLDASTFPEGVTYQCSGSCPRFPADLTVNTQAMKDDKGKMIVKFFVPASDIPAEVTAICETGN